MIIYSSIISIALFIYTENNLLMARQFHANSLESLNENSSVFASNNGLMFRPVRFLVAVVVCCCRYDVVGCCCCHWNVTGCCCCCGYGIIIVVATTRAVVVHSVIVIFVFLSSTYFAFKFNYNLKSIKIYSYWDKSIQTSYLCQGVKFHALFTYFQLKIGRDCLD